jgi:hypothetical protein
MGSFTAKTVTQDSNHMGKILARARHKMGAKNIVHFRKNLPILYVGFHFYFRKANYSQEI